MRTVWTEVVCSRCNTTCAGRFVGERIPWRQVNAEAKSAGFSFYAQDAEWYCARCKKVRLAELREPLIQPAVRTDQPLECMLGEGERISE